MCSAPPLPRIQGYSYTARLSVLPFRRERTAILPKQKTHKGTKKRFRLTASGKVKHRGAGTSHLASRKSKKRRRKLRRTRVLSKTMAHQIVEAVGGYSS